MQLYRYSGTRCNSEQFDRYSVLRYYENTLSKMAQLIRQRSESVDIRGLLDADTPTGEILSGIYKRSFAYYTIKDRLPVILTKIIDILSQDKENLAQKYGNESKEDVKVIVGFISKLKNEMVTNKPLLPLNTLPGSLTDDVNKWNEALNERTEIEHETPTWFKTNWLFCECYMYRRIYQEISSTQWLNKYDPFERQKHDAFINSITSISSLCQYLMNIINKTKSLSPQEIKCEFIKLLKLNLWGNRCDLSLSAGADVSHEGDPIKMLETLEKDLLIDKSNFIWGNVSNSEAGTIDIVLDNAGYELFTDLCLAAFLTSFKYANNIRFYVKRMPWYVSDVTEPDFHWVIKTMNESSNEHLITFGQLCESYLRNNTWSIEVESFWTEPYDFAQMKSKDSALYKKLGQAKLVIFKGDLNYRKLLGDINWEYTTNFTQALRGFRPTTVASLRTLKCDIIVGLSPGQAMSVQEEDPNWLISGRFGIIEAV